MAANGEAARRPLSVLYAVKQVELAVRHHLDEILREVGVTVVQYTALTVLTRREALTSAELARKSFVTAQSMADVVVSLAERGLIVRRPDPRNQRRLLIALTPAAHDLLAALEAPVEALERRMLADLTPEEVGALGRALQSCHRALAAGH